MPVFWQFAGMFSCFLVKYIVLKSTYIMIKFADQLETKIDSSGLREKIIPEEERT